MRIITSTSVVIFFLVCNITFQENKIEDIIQDNKLLWGIDNYVIEDQHYFDLKINHCFKDVVKETVGSPITYFLYKEGMCKCIIEEIKFKDSESLNLAYSALMKKPTPSGQGHVASLDKCVSNCVKRSFIMF